MGKKEKGKNIATKMKGGKKNYSLIDELIR